MLKGCPPCAAQQLSVAHYTTAIYSGGISVVAPMLFEQLSNLMLVSQAASCAREVPKRGSPGGRVLEPRPGAVKPARWLVGIHTGTYASVVAQPRDVLLQPAELLGGGTDDALEF